MSKSPIRYAFRAGERTVFHSLQLTVYLLIFLYFYRLEYTRQDNSKKQEMGVDGPSPDLRVRVSVIFIRNKMSLDGSSAVKTLLAPCVLGLLRGRP